MRALFDTNVLLRAVKPGTGPAKEALVTVVQRGHVLRCTDFILDEVARASTYPRLRSRFSFTDQQIEEFVAELRRAAVMVDTTGVVFSDPISSIDPDDEPIINAALVGNADVLCTWDGDIRHPEVAAQLAARGVRVLTDVELHHILRVLDLPEPAD